MTAPVSISPLTGKGGIEQKNNALDVAHYKARSTSSSDNLVVY